MGGKRPDQYQIDPDEGRTSDHKRMPNTPREADRDDQTFSEAMEGRLAQKQPIPADVPSPEAERARERLDREEEEDEADGDGRSGS